jgi:hypothetical protein
MMRKACLFFVLACIFLAVGSGPQNTPFTEQPVEKADVINLLCGSGFQDNCLSQICDQVDECPLISALSTRAIYDFVKTYAECQDCNTPEFLPERGIGKCVEYVLTKTMTRWTITFWVSDNCSFHYGNPSNSRINVIVTLETFRIESVTPRVEYLKDPLYCQTNADCFCLSGSGVPFIGCSNNLYAPLNISGYYPGNQCVCKANQCVRNH